MIASFAIPAAWLPPLLVLLLLTRITQVTLFSLLGLMLALGGLCLHLIRPRLLAHLVALPVISVSADAFAVHELANKSRPDDPDAYIRSTAPDRIKTDPLKHVAMSLLRRPDWTLTSLVGVGYFLFHALLSHFTPRYSEPLIPLALVCLAAALVTAGRRIQIR
jgi:hypothetical protein